MTANNPHTKKAKGSKFEREIAKKYVDYDIDKDCKRMVGSGAFEGLKGDIRHAHNIAIPFRFRDECKFQEVIKIPEWWKQTVEQCGYGEEPVLHFKSSHKEPLTVIKSETFFGLLGEIVRLYEKKELRGEIILDDSQDRKNVIYQLDYAKEAIRKAKNLLNKE